MIKGYQRPSNKLKILKRMENNMSTKTKEHNIINSLINC